MPGRAMFDQQPTELSTHNLTGTVTHAHSHARSEQGFPAGTQPPDCRLEQLPCLGSVDLASGFPGSYHSVPVLAPAAQGHEASLQAPHPTLTAEEEHGLLSAVQAVSFACPSLLHLGPGDLPECLPAGRTDLNQNPANLLRLRELSPAHPDKCHCSRGLEQGEVQAGPAGWSQELHSVAEAAFSGPSGYDVMGWSE